MGTFSLKFYGDRFQNFYLPSNTYFTYTKKEQKVNRAIKNFILKMGVSNLVGTSSLNSSGLGLYLFYFPEHHFYVFHKKEVNSHAVKYFYFESEKFKISGHF